MSWMILASIPPLLWAISNHIDEYLSKHHFKTSPFLMILGACFIQFPIGLALLAYHPTALNIPFLDIIMISLLGVFVFLCFVPYIKALQIGDASVAVPIFQIIPVLTFFMSWLFLQETVGIYKLIASFVIIFAALAVTWDFSKKSISYHVVFLMLLATFGLSIHNIFSRYYLTNGVDWLTFIIWGLIGTGIFACLAVLFKRSWGQELLSICRNGGLKVSGLFTFQAFLDLAAFSLFAAAMAIAPAAGLVSTMNGLQPFFVIVVAFLAGKYMPEKFKKEITTQTWIWRIFCIIILFAGVATLSLSE